MREARSRAPPNGGLGVSNWLMAARSSWTKWASCCLRLSSSEVFAVDESWLPKQSVRTQPRVGTLAPALSALRSERETIEAALAECRARIGGPSGAAAKLGVPPSTLNHRIKALNIEKARFKFR